MQCSDEGAYQVAISPRSSFGNSLTIESITFKSILSSEDVGALGVTTCNSNPGGTGTSSGRPTAAPEVSYAAAPVTYAAAPVTYAAAPAVTYASARLSIAG